MYIYMRETERDRVCTSQLSRTTIVPRTTACRTGADSALSRSEPRAPCALQKAKSEVRLDGIFDQFRD